MNSYKRLILKGQSIISESNPINRDIKFNFEYLELNKIISFIGPRRAGKTYFMIYILKELIKNHKIELDQIIFIDFTSFLYDDFDIEKLLENFYELNPKKIHFSYLTKFKN